MSSVTPAYGYGYANNTYPKHHKLVKKLCNEAAEKVSAVDGLEYACNGDKWCKIN